MVDFPDGVSVKELARLSNFPQYIDAVASKITTCCNPTADVGLIAPVQVASEVYSRHIRFAMAVYAATERASLIMDDHGNNVVIA